MKFSIVTPSFNQGDFIEETIKSVIGQKGDFQIEYFVMDGGSIDKTVEILKKYEKLLQKNQKIKFYWQSKKDKGQTDAINQGLVKATGDIIAYINSDDYYLPDAFKLVCDYFYKHPQKKWLVGNCRVSDPHFSWTFWLKHIWPIHIFKSALYTFNTINQPSVFLKKTLIDKVGIFNTRYHYAFDYDYWLRCLDFSLPGRLFKFLSVFRIHANSKGNTNFNNQFDEDWAIFIKQQPNDFLYFFHALAKKFVKFVYKKMK